MKNITNLNIFETNLLDGPMRLKYEYFPEITEGVSKRKITDEMTEEMKEEFLKIRIDAGEKYGFDGKKIVVPCEDDTLNVGDYFVADSSVYNMDEDLWNVDIPGDIVLLRENNPGMVIAFPVSDDPVLIVEDRENKITALTHCNIDRISDKIPSLIIDSLVNEVGSNINDLRVYISSHIKSNSNICFKKPKSIKENKEIWKKCVSHKSGAFKMKFRKNCGIYNKLLFRLGCRISLEKAIINMLIKKGINRDNIIISDVDTYESVLHYSDQKVKITKEELIKGKFLVGAYYESTFPRYSSKCQHTGKSLIRKL